MDFQSVALSATSAHGHAANAQKAVASSRSCWRNAPAALVQAADAETNAGPSRWESEIRTFESADKNEFRRRRRHFVRGQFEYPAVENAGTGFPRIPRHQPRLRRLEIADSVAFAERIVIPCRPKTMCSTRATTTWRRANRRSRCSPAQKRSVQKVLAALPETRIAYSP